MSFKDLSQILILQRSQNLQFLWSSLLIITFDIQQKFEYLFFRPKFLIFICCFLITKIIKRLLLSFIHSWMQINQPRSYWWFFHMKIYEQPKFIFHNNSNFLQHRRNSKEFKFRLFGLLKTWDSLLTWDCRLTWELLGKDCADKTLKDDQGKAFSKEREKSVLVWQSLINRWKNDLCLKSPWNYWVL